MDLEELRLNCLRMAHELGGKPEAIISAANDLMNFVTKGPSADARASAPEPAVAPSEVSAPGAELAVTDRVAACGTALEMPESGNLAHAEPAVEVKAAAEAELAAQAEVTEAVPSEATAEEAATIAAPTAEVEAAEPAAAPSPEPVEPLAEATNGGSAGPAAAPEVEAAAVAAEPAASASEVVAPSSEEHAPAAAPVTDGSGQEHTAN
jgi:hypothetical protein